VAPEKVENILVQSSWLGQVWLHGDSLNNHCLMIACVDELKLKAWAEANGKSVSQETLED
jgi:long-subunit acyl-CoA synthetase (AMP-forming)